MTVCTWDPANIGSNITLSNGNLTWTATSATASAGRATLGYVAGNGVGNANLFLYFEVTATSATYPTYFPEIGISNQNMPFTNYVGYDTNGLGYASNGNVVYGSTAIDNFGVYNSGVILGTAVDFLHQKTWWTVNGTTWNDDTITNQNPATNTGGVSSTFVFQNAGYLTVYPAFGTAATNSSMTGNFARPFAYTLPVGFSAWQPLGPGHLIRFGDAIRPSSKLLVAGAAAAALRRNPIVTRRGLILPRPSR